jgi:FkbM family methyltransferase
MGISYAIGNIFLATQKYKNWAEIMIAIAKRKEPAKVILKNGLQIETEVALKFLVREIFFRKIYSPAYLPIQSNDVVVDIGANNGVFTLFAASITRNTVYAFEPFPRNFEFLKRNIAANGLSNVVAYDIAVSDKIGSTKLFLNPDCGMQNLLVDHIIPEKIEEFKNNEDLDYLSPKQLEKFIEVRTTTLQEIMDSNNIKQVDFLKLDCEGAEGSILNSTSKEYLKRIRKIAMEFHDHLSHFNHNDIQKLLEDIGFMTKLKWDKKSPLGYLYAWRDGLS